MNEMWVWGTESNETMRLMGVYILGLAGGVWAMTVQGQWSEGSIGEILGRLLSHSAVFGVILGALWYFIISFMVSGFMTFHTSSGGIFDGQDNLKGEKLFITLIVIVCVMSFTSFILGKLTKS
jgi:hypothetical protein